MALKKLQVTETVTKAAKKDEMPVVLAENDVVQKYNEAVAKQKDAEAVVKLLKPTIMEKALPFLFNLNCSSPATAVATVRVEDATGEGVRVSFQDRYSAADAEVVSNAFDEMTLKDGTKPDVNDYVQQSVKVTLDSTSFLNAKGDFDEGVYSKFVASIAAAAATLGIKNPLSSKIVVLPKPGFHSVRWTKFNVEQQKRLMEVLPNVVSATSVK